MATILWSRLFFFAFDHASLLAAASRLERQRCAMAGRRPDIGTGVWIGSLAIVGMCESEGDNLVGSRGRKIRVKRAAATEATSRTHGVPNLSSCLLFFDGVDGADLLTNEDYRAALRTTGKSQLTLAIAAAAALIPKFPTGDEISIFLPPIVQ
jgi:hypothetical protein